MLNKYFKAILIASALIFSNITFANAQQEVSKNNFSETFTITPEQFRQNFNSHAVAMGGPKLHPVQYQKTGNIFSIKLNEDFLIAGQTKGKKITKLATLLKISEENKDQLPELSKALGGVALTAIRALDNNKVNEDRDNVLHDTYDSLINDPETGKGENRKTGAYNNFYIYSTFLPNIASLVITFEPRVK